MREDGIAPQVVWEVLSPGNRAGELREKFEFYQRYGVEEYYQYDPDRGELRGWLRADGELQPIAAIQGWVSPRPAPRMELAGMELALTHPNGEPFESFAECFAAKDQSLQARASAGRYAAKDALNAVVPPPGTRGKPKARVAEAQRQREDAEARVARLAAQLRALGIEPEG